MVAVKAKTKEEAKPLVTDRYLDLIEAAVERISDVVLVSSLVKSHFLSEKYQADVYLKREDLQQVRSYKIRGAYNKIKSLTKSEQDRGVVCASAGNHAQGVAYSCAKLKIKGHIFMPVVTPNQKISMVRKFGGKFTEIVLKGNTFDEASLEAQAFCKKNKMVFVHPFDDPLTIAGQGTLGREMVNQAEAQGVVFDYLFGPIGGGGMMSGVSMYFKAKSSKTKLIGVEPMGAAKMSEAFKEGKPVTLPVIDTFVDGCAVKTAGQETYRILSQTLKKILKVPEGKVCTAMIDLYQKEGIIAEPAGALAVSSLDFMKDEIKGKKVVCIISGGNNDILRYPEVMERSLIFEGLRHYMLVKFAQKPGQLKSFLMEVLAPTDDIIRFEYIKKTNAETGPAMVGIEVAQPEHFEKLCQRMKSAGISFELLNGNNTLFKYIV